MEHQQRLDAIVQDVLQCDQLGGDSVLLSPDAVMSLTRGLPLLTPGLLALRPRLALRPGLPTRPPAPTEGLPSVDTATMDRCFAQMSDAPSDEEYLAEASLEDA